jgi:tetratricopeptide (TPR) repeat protein
LLASAQASVAARQPEAAGRYLHQFLNLADRSNLWPKRQEWATAHLLLADLEPAAAPEHWGQAWAIHAPTAAEMAFLRRRELPRVLKTFRQEAAAKPWDWYAQANYGLGLLETAHPAQAVVPLSRAAALAPDKDGIRLHLARALAQSGQTSKALPILDRLLKTLPPSPMRQAAQQLQAQLRGGGG